jgi:hypothetical protein
MGVERLDPTTESASARKSGSRRSPSWAWRGSSFLPCPSSRQRPKSAAGLARRAGELETYAVVGVPVFP